jgi:uncharacterized protein (TIGR02996 family)
MRTFNFTDAKSHKFWNIELKGKSLTVTYGRIGTAGQTQTKSFADEAKTLKEHDKLVREKLSKGYVETTPAAKATPTSLRESLEAALAENPNDLASHMAYADHLVELGDPRGEFIQVQLALEDESKPPDQRKKLQQQEKKLQKTHATTWLGEIAPLFLTSEEDLDGSEDTFDLEYGFGKESNHFHFVRGWLDRLTLDGFSPRLAEVLGRAPTIGLLRSLIIRHSEDDPGYDELARWATLGTLRRFQLGPDDDQCHISGEGISAAIARMTNLEELYLYAHRVDVHQVFALPLPRLRIFHAFHLHEYPFKVLAGNSSLGNLTTLTCWPHALEPWHEQAYIQPDDFQVLVRSPHLKSLTHLALYLTNVGNESMPALVKSGLLKQLRVLDLWNSRIGDEGARILAACPDLRRLEKLRLAGNCLTSQGIRLLRDTGVNLEAEGQHTAQQIEDHAHLWEGDCE